MKKDSSETILVTGALADPELAVVAVRHGLKQEDFGDSRAGRIWALFVSAEMNNEIITPSRLKSIAKVEGLEEEAEYYARCVTQWPGSRDMFLRTLAKVRFDSRRRRSLMLVKQAEALLADASDEESLQKAVYPLREAIEATNEKQVARLQTSGEVARKLANKVKEPVRRLQTGIHKLDNVLGGGLELGRVISIIGKYKIGKTTLLSTVGYNVAYGEGEKDKDNTAKVLFITLERNQSDVETMNMCRTLGINMADLERLVESRKVDIADYLDDPARDSILYYHRPGATIDEIETIIHSAVRKHGVELVLIDYYQIIGKTTNTGRLNDHLMNVDQTINRIAADLNIAIIIAAQSDAEGGPRDSKTLLHSASANFTIRRQDQLPDAWLENLASNYRRQRDAGSPTDPAMTLNEDAGPHFKSL